MDDLFNMPEIEGDTPAPLVRGHELCNGIFDALAVWQEIAAGTVSHISLTPAMLARLLDVADGAVPPPTLRHAMIGGAALSRPLFVRARAAGWPLRPSWGMSESAAQAATRTSSRRRHRGRTVR